MRSLLFNVYIQPSLLFLCSSTVRLVNKRTTKLGSVFRPNGQFMRSCLQLLITADKDDSSDRDNMFIVGIIMADKDVSSDRDNMFIVGVQKHKCLYDVNRSDYKDQIKKFNAWKAVATAMNWNGGL